MTATKRTKLQKYGDKRAGQFIDLYQTGVSAKDICTAMGWKSKNPPQRVHRQLKRLRDRGYDIPVRMPNQNRTRS